MNNDVANAALWAAVFTPSADEIAREIVQQEYEMRKMEEEAYWKGWDMEVKRGVIERLRDPNDELSLLSYKSKAEQADLIESGELKIVASIKEPTGFGVIWADNTREEAQNPREKEVLKLVNEYVLKGSHRIIS